MTESPSTSHKHGARRRRRHKRGFKRVLLPVLAGVLLVLAMGAWLFVLSDGADTRIIHTPSPSGPTKAGGSDMLVRLPGDDAAHHNTTEWWYYNGHLRTDGGQRFAYHVAVFLRRELSDHTVFHVSLVDLGTGRHYSGQARTAGVPTSVREAGFDFTYPGWRVAGSGANHRVHITTKDFTLALDLSDARQPTLHQVPGTGSPGLLDFGAAGKSYYYSRMRMPSRGTLTLGGAARPVTGESWFDHQWGDFESTALKWNWFALQLDDGTDIMLYQVFDPNGRPVTQAGTIHKEGKTTLLGTGDYTLKPGERWISPESKVAYPVTWEISLPGHNLSLAAKAPVSACEFNGLETIMKIYWEGPVAISGSRRGVGYMELSGYGKAPGL